MKVGDLVRVDWPPHVYGDGQVEYLDQAGDTVGVRMAETRELKAVPLGKVRVR